MLLSRERAIFSIALAEVQNRRRRSQSYVEDDFVPTTQREEIAAVRSKNEFLEVPLILYQLDNRIKLVRRLDGHIAELALIIFVVVDRNVRVF